MPEVIVDDELIEIEEGPDALLRYVHQAKEAGDQIKAWGRVQAIAKAAIEELQPDRKASYDTDFGTLVVSKRAPSFTNKVNVEKLLEHELTNDELRAVLAGATAINPKKVPVINNALPALIEVLTEQSPRKGFVVIETGTKYAP